MTSYGQIKGGEDFAKLQKRLKETGDKTVRRELYRGLNRSVKPLKAAVKQELPKRLPDRYAAELAKSLKVTTRRRAGRNPMVALRGTAKTRKGKARDLGSLNRGRLRHPLYGNRRHWYDQRIDPGWWTDVLNASAPQVRKEIQRTLDGISKSLKKGN